MKRYRYRAYPTGDQAQSLARTFGCCRFIFNRVIERARQDRAVGIRYRGATAYQSEVLTKGKALPELAFLREVSGVALIQAVRDADTAYRALQS